MCLSKCLLMIKSICLWIWFFSINFNDFFIFGVLFGLRHESVEPGPVNKQQNCHESQGVEQVVEVVFHNGSGCAC